MNAKGKIALITGGAHRVGKAITLMLAEAGANVVVNYNRSDKAALETVEEATAYGVEGLAIQCDVTDWRAVKRMVQTIEERFGGVDIIVNSASFFGRTPFPPDKLNEESVQQWHDVTRILTDGPFFVCSALAPSMQARGQGVIINIVDLSVWVPWPNLTAHSVGKSGLLALTRQLALELAPTVRVNAIAPGPVLAPPDYDERMRAVIADRTLLDCWGSAEDVAKAVKYLVEADYVTGDVMTVDGGERYGPRKSRKKKEGKEV